MDIIKLEYETKKILQYNNNLAKFITAYLKEDTPATRNVTKGNIYNHAHQSRSIADLLSLYNTYSEKEATIDDFIKALPEINEEIEDLAITNCCLIGKIVLSKLENFEADIYGVTTHHGVAFAKYKEHEPCAAINISISDIKKKLEPIIANGETL